MKPGVDNLPTKEWIDSVSYGHPVFVSRYDGHMGLANSIALKLAGINKSTPNPPGGEIVKDPKTGEPTGILRDEATSLVYNVIPDPTEKELDESLAALLPMVLHTDLLRSTTWVLMADGSTWLLTVAQMLQVNCPSAFIHS